MSEKANPFASQVLAEDNGIAVELRRLVINLFNNTAHPDMGALMLCAADFQRLALDMLEHYAKHGENCPVFMRVASGLAEAA